MAPSKTAEQMTRETFEGAYVSPHIGDFCAPGTVYADLDIAMHAASCLSGQHEDGATIYSTTDAATIHALQGPCLTSGEAYVVAVPIIQRVSGLAWAVPEAPYWAIYTITSKGGR